VTSLSRLYRPFEPTPDDYRGCQGSSPHLRGYPCSLWTLFHSLTVNAAIEAKNTTNAGNANATFDSTKV
jgi:hypothetical protein